MVVRLLTSSSVLQLQGMSLCSSTHVIQTAYRFAVSLIHLRQLYTVESNALIAAWLSESMMIFRLWTFLYTIINTAA